MPEIFADLTADIDLTSAGPLKANKGWALLGIQKSGPFDITGEVARRWMALPPNPNKIPNSKVIRPYWNGDDVTGRPRDMYFIDLPLGLEEKDAAAFQEPFHHLKVTPDEEGKVLSELRLALGERAGPRWWEPHWPRPEMRARILDMPRFIVTPETSENRLFVWMAPPILPDKNLIVIPRSDDFFFGLLHSRFHAAWAARKGSDLQDRPRYTHTTTFATYPFPDGYGPNDPVPDTDKDVVAEAVAKAAFALNEMRVAWMCPEGYLETVDVDKPWGPRQVPVSKEAAATLAGRTMSGLYKAQPEWLKLAHLELDKAVARAYGWDQDIGDHDALAALLDLNKSRS